MTKLKHLTLIALAIFIVSASGCGDSSDGGETPSGLAGTWRLTNMAINLDGNPLTTITAAGFQATLDDASFTYSHNGQRSGTWSINEDETELTINFGSNSSVFPINSKTDTQLIFTIKTIDLNGALSEDEKALSALINQRLNQSGSSWVTATSGGQSISVVFTLAKS